MNTTTLCPLGADSALASTRFLLGVDGGGTGTRVRLSDLQGQCLGQGEAGPSALGQGAEQAWRHIQQAAQQAALNAGLPALDWSQMAVGLGMSGSSVTHLVEAFMAQQPGCALLALDSDGFTTVLGAHGGQAGAVVAAGTGSIGEALRRDGSRACISGWGWICGDEGSGAWLGLKAMRHAQQAMDGRAVVGTLARAVWAVAGHDREAVLAWCAQAGQAGYASLAPVVFEHRGGDGMAAALVQEAVIELERLAMALDPAGDLPLALCGSVALRLAPDFSGTIAGRCVSPQGDSADGALHLVRSALQRLRT
ncbi:glucosamine kinase nucleotide-binding domain-containing protein [Roseateles koreensis]|uniref:BadF/BadG/BcrA/BcrD ATPase family protein n=1 Tax=Roseateles koreensis TaxID=2987526 RepID=A0ABT5KQ58_9BURK|nr:BadF/BadG/BcrA/BcrD ATPase family protein [Roseateles koreensis]MDC8785055.1 BadF/BadG/BcrA/BcrD ATPase family protein [Roseateles koreensis]